MILFNLQLGGTPIRKELFGEFISALEQFTDHLEKADVKSVILGPIQLTLSQLDFADLVLAVRTESIIPEKKVNKILQDLRDKMRMHFVKKTRGSPTSQILTNIGFSLEFDDEINDIFFNLQ
jgi:G3E family GTPase